MADKDQTIKTYDRSAKSLADYFAGIGSRVADIDVAMAFAGYPDAPKIFEIGCGDGSSGIIQSVLSKK